MNTADRRPSCAAIAAEMPVAMVIAMVLAITPIAPSHAAPPSQETIIKACEEADSAAQCERLIERQQMMQFPRVATRDGAALRISTKPGMPAVELRDTGTPDNEAADFKWHSLWDYWPESKIAVVSVTTRDTDHFLIVQLDRGMQVRVPTEPIVSPDGQRFFVTDFCDKGCGNQIQLWKIDRTRAIREKTFRPRERWYEPDISWRDASTLAIEYSVAGPRRRLADAGEPNLVKAEPMVLKLSDWGWVSDDPRR